MIAQHMYQCVYVLTSDGNDIFADMTRISMMSLRMNNPNAYIVLVCDSASKSALEKCGHVVITECDSVISISTPEGPPVFRNRYIKTSLRQHLSGPFLYLDADTVIRGDLSEVFKTTASFSAAPNHSGSGDPAEMPVDERENFELLKWALPSYYVNGGVLFFADSAESYKFCELWHQKWLASVAQIGRFRDQPSLNSAVADSKVSFSWLANRFNAQIDVRPAYAENAVIWHLYSSMGSIALKTVFDEYIVRLQQGYEVTPDYIKLLCQQPYPWRIKNPVDWLCVQRMLSRDQLLKLNSFERLWMNRNYAQAKAELKNLIKNQLRSPSILVRSMLRNLFKIA